MSGPVPPQDSADSASAAMRVSFVIPARNEERYIGEALGSIHSFAPDPQQVEIVVVDNGSTDRTVELARAGGAQVLVHPGGTVGSLRNVGVARTSGEVVVFLDADVLLTPAWQQRIDTALSEFVRTPDIVTGSRCGISREASWIERVWFKPLLAERANYINSGHLITSRALFDRLGGFDTSRETGEDSDFSNRARALGAAIVNDPALKVIHEGYPKKVSQFFRRERWHGQGNFQSWRTVLGSRIAPLTVAFLTCHLALVAALAVGSAGGAAACAAIVATICLTSAFAKYRSTGASIPAATYLYYWYYAARSLALVDVLRSRLIGARSAPGRHR